MAILVDAKRPNQPSDDFYIIIHIKHLRWDFPRRVEQDYQFLARWWSGWCVVRFVDRQGSDFEDRRSRNGSCFWLMAQTCLYSRDDDVKTRVSGWIVQA